MSEDNKDKDRKPWDKRDDETARNYEAFCVYRDLGPGRTLSVCATKISSYSYIKKWSTRFDWVDRCAAWDAHLQKIRDEEKEEAVREAEQLISSELKDITRRAIKEAKNGSPQMLKDLLDRAGVGEERSSTINHNFSEGVAESLNEILGKSVNDLNAPDGDED